MGATAQFFAWRRPPVNDALEAPIMVKVMAWNIARRDEAWRYLLDADADMALSRRRPHRRLTLRGAWMSILPPGEQRAQG
jgi:hypothetical protein